jgi:hypothetical protein
VQTGTLLFTLYERVHSQNVMNLWNNDHKLRAIKEGLVARAASKLAEDVVGKSRHLAALREKDASQGTTQANVGL